MAFIFLRNALKLSTEGTHLNLPFCWILKFHPRKSKPSVDAVILVFFSLIFIPLSARNWLIFSSILVALSLGLRKNTMSSAYLTDGCISSIPLSAMLAKSGLTTPPWGVPCSGNSGCIPAFRHRKIPIFSPFGAIRFPIIVV